MVKRGGTYSYQCVLKVQLLCVQCRKRIEETLELRQADNITFMNVRSVVTNTTCFDQMSGRHLQKQSQSLAAQPGTATYCVPGGRDMLRATCIHT